jgi:hypothetical protein
MACVVPAAAATAAATAAISTAPIAAAIGVVIVACTNRAAADTSDPTGTSTSTARQQRHYHLPQHHIDHHIHGRCNHAWAMATASHRQIANQGATQTPSSRRAACNQSSGATGSTGRRHPFLVIVGRKRICPRNAHSAQQKRALGAAILRLTSVHAQGSQPRVHTSRLPGASPRILRRATSTLPPSTQNLRKTAKHLFYQVPGTYYLANYTTRSTMVEYHGTRVLEY